MPLLRPHFADDAFAAGPWCWPRDGDRLGAVLRRHGAVPASAVGSTAAITVRGGSAVLWHVRAGRSADQGATLGPETRASWRHAAIAVPRGLPVLWSSMHDATARLPDVRWLASVRSSQGIEDTSAPIDGPSFGLAFCLMLASVVLECALPGNLVASAAVDPAGVVGPVGGLVDKVRALSRMAPRVTHLLVAASQRDEAEAAAGDRLAIVPVTHASEAIDAAFGAQLADLIVAAGRDPGRRADLTESFFRLALVGSSSLVDWGPVARGASDALAHWADLPPDARHRLTFAHAVAVRHASNSGALDSPPDAWIASLPRMVRVQVVAHLVQQSADTGRPSAGDAERLAARWIDTPLEDSAPPELRLRGALARLHAVTGAPQSALATQEALARAFAAIYQDHDVAYPLSEWARLAGALRDEDALRRAEAFHDRMRAAGDYTGLGPRYVELALVRGRALLHPDDSDACARAAPLAGDATLPDHVRWSAARWAGQAGRAALERAAASGDVMAERNLALARLDEAIRAGDASGADTCVDVLARLDPGPLGHLRRAGSSAETIARMYPY